MKVKLEYEYDHIDADSIIKIAKDFDNAMAAKDKDVKLIEFKITAE